MSKIRFSYGTCAFFEEIWRRKMRCCFGAVLGRFGEGFWKLVGRDLVDFEGGKSALEKECV